MTAPIPFNVPNVQPMYFDTSQMQKGGFHERLKLLMDVLHNRETRMIQERELRNQEALRKDQETAGLQLAQMVRGMDTVPGMNLPTALPGGAGPTIQTPAAEGPVARAFAPGKPGTAYFEAFKTGQNTISQYMNDRNEAMKARAKAPDLPPEHEYVDANGFALVRPKGTKSAYHVLGPDGLPLRVRIPNQEVEGPSWTLSGYERGGIPLMFNKRGELREVPGAENVFKAGTLTEAMDRSAGFYTESAEAWKTLKATGFRAMPRDLIGFVAGARRAIGEGGSFEAYLANSHVFDDDTKQALIAYILLGMNNLYKKSGAAITVKEMEGMLHRIPVEGESRKLTRAKLRFWRAGIEAQFRSGYDILRRGEAEAGMPYVKPYDLFADEPGVDPATQQPWTKENPYMAQPQAGGPPPLLRRPR